MKALQSDPSGNTFILRLEKFTFPIFVKALILVLLTLLPPLCVLTALYNFGKTEANSLESVRREASAAIGINEIASAVFLAGGFHFLWLSSDKPEDREKSLCFKRIAQQELDKLKVFAAKYPSKRSVWDKFTEQVEEHFADTLSISTFSFGDDARLRMKKLRHLSFDAYQRFEQYQRAASIQLEELQHAINRSIQATEMILSVSIAGLICNLILAILLMYLFNRKVIDRLKLLVQNASRLPKRQSPLEPVDGSDEISELNEVFQIVLEKLQKTQQHNRSLLSIVAHDMCSPLASMNLSLAMVENSEGERLNLDDSAAISEASEQIDLLVVRAKDILNVERLTRGESAQLEPSLSDARSASVQELSRLTRIELDSPDQSDKEANQRFRPRVMKLGLVLFSLPIVFASLLFFSVANTSMAEERALKEELQETLIAVRVNRMIAFGMGSYGFLTNYLMYGKIDDLNRAQLLRRNELDAGAEASDLLCSHSSSSAALRQNFEALQTLRLKEAKHFEQPVAGKLAFADAPGLPLILQGRRLMRFAITKQECLWNMSCEQTRALSNLVDSQRRLQENMEKLLCAGLFLCVLLAFISVFLFSKFVGTRLKIVRANASRLPHRQSLEKPLGGSDEIWYLDFVLHRADQLLELSFRQRSALMSAVAEDLRRPLNRVRQILAKFDSSRIETFSPAAKRHFRLTQENAARILSLIDTLLSAQSLESGKIELRVSEFNLNDVAGEAVDTLSALADSRKVTLQNQCQSLEIEADREKIAQVLINYLTNAINHSPASSTVSIRSNSHCESITIEVIDGGPGLPAEMLEEVFERYFQTPDSKTRGKGYGLGLAICKMIAESHSGQVGVRNMPDGGCSFYITIPCRYSDADSVAR